MQDEQVKDQQNPQGEQQDAGKDHKKFEDVVDKIMAVLNGDESVFKKKVGNDRVSELVSKLTEKRREKAEEDFSVEFDKLLDEYITFKKECAQKEQEFKKAVADKEKAFTKRANEVLGKLENIGQYYGQYKAALKRATGGDGNNPNPEANAS